MLFPHVVQINAGIGLLPYATTISWPPRAHHKVLCELRLSPSINITLPGLSHAARGGFAVSVPPTMISLLRCTRRYFMSIANARLYHWFISTSGRIDRVVTKKQGSAEHSRSPRNLLKGNAPDMPNYFKGALLYSSLPHVVAHLIGQGT